MSSDTYILATICWGAVCSTLFVLLYPALSPGWRRTWIGWALLTSSTALALLLDLSVAGRVFGRDYLHYQAVAGTVTTLVALGATLKLTALLVTKFRDYLDES
jgi:uncharacterized membrane protein YkvI